MSKKQNKFYTTYFEWSFSMKKKWIEHDKERKRTRMVRKVLCKWIEENCK